MRRYLDKKIKVILRFKINSDAKSLNTKISTVLAQRRLTSADFFVILKDKLEELGIREDKSIPLRVFLCILKLDEYLIYIRMPSVTHLLNHFFNVNKNYKCPGFSYKKRIRRKRKFFNYILTPYILYEISNYRYKIENIERIFMESFYHKCVSSLKSKGINIAYFSKLKKVK